MAESEKCVELALNSSLGKQKVMHILYSFLFLLFHQTFAALLHCSLSLKRKLKVLSVLSRALERDPKSVLIWIVYLHIYYMKEKDLGKDDMFLDAVHCSYFIFFLSITILPCDN